MVFQVPGDGVRTGVQAGGGQLLPVLHDQVDDLCGRGPRHSLRATGAGLEGGLTLGLVAGHELEQPGLGDAVLGGDMGDGSVLDHHGGDQQSF